MRLAPADSISGALSDVRLDVEVVRAGALEEGNAHANVPITARATIACLIV